MTRRSFVAVPGTLIAAVSLHGVDSRLAALNGRWDLSVPGDDRKRAWWLEIKGADTPSPEGSFIGAPGGGLDVIRDMKVSPTGEAAWTFTRPARNNQQAWKGIYKVHLDGQQLIGTLGVDGRTTQQFTGVRAPTFHHEDISKLKPGPSVDLFNGKDLAGWHALRSNTPFLWKVENGILKNGPGTTDIVSDRKFMNFRLHVEYRVGEHSNSGIGLRGRYEVQILDDYGKPPDTHGNGALYSRILPTTNASKPANEWQTFDITLAGNLVTIVLNGTKIIDTKEIDGLTAVAMDPNESEPGPILLQGDHGPVEFRKVILTPLERK
jgi:hypothetical protein